MSTQERFETDTFETTAGDLEITFLGHGTLMLNLNGQVFHIDPYSRVADYARLPKADVILVTHEHGDHLDLNAIAQIRTDDTRMFVSQTCVAELGGGIVMHNGDAQSLNGVKIEAVPAYNIAHKRPNGQPFHPKGEGNGYILTFGDTRVYIAGDTENIPEMAALTDIDIAFLPMNLPYTMTPEMAAECARAFRPRILYPYHFGDTDTSRLVALLAEEKEIEIRIRKLA